MSTTKQRDPRKEQFWRRMVRQWRDSGLSIAEFCRRQGLSAASFHAWRRIVAQRDLEAASFVPVRVRAETGAGATDRAASGLELVLQGDRRLQIGPAFDDATLRRLLAVLEEG
jgi:transposase-like protein